MRARGGGGSGVGEIVLQSLILSWELIIYGLWLADTKSGASASCIPTEGVLQHQRGSGVSPLHTQSNLIFKEGCTDACHFHFFFIYFFKYTPIPEILLKCGLENNMDSYSLIPLRFLTNIFGIFFLFVLFVCFLLWWCAFVLFWGFLFKKKNQKFK